MSAVYHLYWSTAGVETQIVDYDRDGRPIHVNMLAGMRKHLEETDDIFVLIITRLQWSHWQEMYEKYTFSDFLLYQMPYFVSNRRYPNDGRKLQLIILKGTGKSNA